MPTTQKAITIRMKPELKDWIKDHSCNSRTQTGLFTEAIILYYRAYLYFKPHLLRFTCDNFKTFITPVIAHEHYELLSQLNTGRGSRRIHKQAASHLRLAITIYSHLFEDLGVYNIQEIDIQDNETGVLTLLNELEIIDITTGAFKR